MFNGAMFWSSLGGIGGGLLVISALFFVLYLSIENDDTALGLVVATPVALLGIAGISLSLALTNGWAS